MNYQSLELIISLAGRLQPFFCKDLAPLNSNKLNFCCPLPFGLVNQNNYVFRRARFSLKNILAIVPAFERLLRLARASNHLSLTRTEPNLTRITVVAPSVFCKQCAAKIPVANWAFSGFFIDLTKRFDRTNHVIFITNLHQHGIRGVATNLLAL